MTQNKRCKSAWVRVGPLPSLSRWKRKPIAYASRTVNKNEMNNSQIDKEAAAIIFGVNKFRQYVSGRHFTLRCDNKALGKLFVDKFGTPVLAASRLTRWSLIFNMYDFEIEFRSTTNHSNANMLSRLPMKDTASVSEIDMMYHIQVNADILKETASVSEIDMMYHIQVNADILKETASVSEIDMMYHIQVNADILKGETSNDPELKLVLNC